MKRLLATGIFFGITGLGSMAAMPGFLGAGVQAVADQDQSRVNFWAVMILLLGAVTAWTTIMRHRRALACFITSASRLQQLIAKQAKDLGADLPKYVSTGEVVSVNSNDVERVSRVFHCLWNLDKWSLNSWFVGSYLCPITSNWSCILNQAA
jgi:ABC-type transport system involved in cytochrome bd biosynthesis fused ATPase/permease subunit